LLITTGGGRGGKFGSAIEKDRFEKNYKYETLFMFSQVMKKRARFILEKGKGREEGEKGNMIS